MFITLLLIRHIVFITLLLYVFLTLLNSIVENDVFIVYNYNKKLADTASKTLAKNWSMIFCALLEEIDLDPNGDFMVCFYAEIKSITGDLQDEFPNIETIDRLVVQYAVYLGTWR